jgi:hypothetical protein
MSFVKKLVPGTFRSGGLVRSVYEVSRGLLRDYGWIRTFRAGQCVDALGNPIPWFTYPAIDYLAQLDYTGKSVFEWGCGNSTLFWGSKGAARVIGAEYDQAWYERLKARAPGNCTIVFCPRDLVQYPATIRGRGPFDVIVVDGSPETRLVCSQEAVQHLMDTGMIILDDADLCPQSARFLRSTGLIEVDFTGFGPQRICASTTSLFLTRKFDFPPAGDQPRRSAAQRYDPYPGV